MLLSVDQSNDFDAVFLRLHHLKIMTAMPPGHLRGVREEI
jgi:hypothetical protein